MPLFDVKPPKNLMVNDNGSSFAHGRVASSSFNQAWEHTFVSEKDAKEAVNYYARVYKRSPSEFRITRR